jgi:hypothetical protein
MAKMCFQRPTNIVVVTSDEEDVMNNNKKCEVFNTRDEINITENAEDKTEEEENKVPVDLDKIIIKRRIKKDKHDQEKLFETITVGTTVSCRTCLDKEIEGEVLAFDSTTRMLIIKSNPTSGRPSQNNVTSWRTSRSARTSRQSPPVST